MSEVGAFCISGIVVGDSGSKTKDQSKNRRRSLDKRLVNRIHPEEKSVNSLIDVGNWD
jgi:hypothetical protein